MTQQVTKGIKISVETFFEGMFYKNYKLHFAYAYRISIENQGNDAVQLKSRYWKIKDALNDPETVVGDGVIGKQPIIQPGGRHSYQSGCLLTGAFGSMHGHYNMINIANKAEFKVTIPSFQLSATYALN